MSGTRPWARWSIGIAIAVVAVDQLVKWAVSREFGRGSNAHERWLFRDWLGLAYAENTGVAFGLLRGRPAWMLVTVAIVIVAGLGLFARANATSPWVVAGAGLIAGGAAGNMLDRVMLGYVRDFVAVGPWPSFNVADAAITCGVAATLIGLLLMEREREHVNPGVHARTRRAETVELSE